MLLQVLSVVLNFCLLAFLLGKFLVPRLSEFMDKKTLGINQSIDETEKNLADVTLELDLVRKEMQEAEQQLALISSEAEARGVAAAEKIKADTQNEIAQMKIRVDKQIEQEVHTLQLRLRQDLVQQIMKKAEELVTEEANKKVHTQLIEDFAYTLKDFKEYQS